MRILFLIGLLSGYSSFAQITIADFIGSAANDARVKSTEAQQLYLQSKPYKLSPLQRLEFRTQNRELSPDKQEYAFRFIPSNPWELKSNNQYFNQYESYLSLGKDLALKEALTQRYLAVVEYLYRWSLKSLELQQLQLISKQVSVMERQQGSSFFDADEFVKLKLEQVTSMTDLEEAGFEWEQQQAFVYSLMPTNATQPVQFENQPVISVARMEAVIDSLHSKEVHPLLLAYRQQRLNVDKSRYNLEKNNINFGFLQTEYDDRRANQNRTPFNIGLGITIPITNPNKGDMTRRQLDVIESEHELKEAEAGLSLTKNASFARAKAAISRYKSIVEKIHELEQSRLADDLTLIKGGDPLVRLQFDGALVKMKMLEAKSLRTVMTSYIHYLSSSDHIHQRPMVNFFSNELKRLD